MIANIITAGVAGLMILAIVFACIYDEKTAKFRRELSPGDQVLAFEGHNRYSGVVVEVDDVYARVEIGMTRKIIKVLKTDIYRI